MNSTLKHGQDVQLYGVARRCAMGGWVRYDSREHYKRQDILSRVSRNLARYPPPLAREAGDDPAHLHLHGSEDEGAIAELLQ